MRPRSCSAPSSPVTSSDGGRRGQHDVGAEHDLALEVPALGDDRARAEEAAVLDDHGARAGRLEHAADAHAARDVDVAADLRARADGRPGVDHRARADARADVDVGRHEHRARLDERAAAHRGRRHDADAGGRRVALERDLVVVGERPDLDLLPSGAGGSTGGSRAASRRGRPTRAALGRGLGEAELARSSPSIVASTALGIGRRASNAASMERPMEFVVGAHCAVSVSRIRSALRSGPSAPASRWTLGILRSQPRWRRE